MDHSKGKILAWVFASYVVAVLALTLTLASNPLMERRSFLKEPGLDFTSETEEEYQARIALALQQTADAAFEDYADQFLSKLKLVAHDGTIKNELNNEYDYRQLPDFAAISHIPDRKKAFFDYLRPAVEYQNQLIRERRVILKGIEIFIANGGQLSGTQQRYMKQMRKRYRIDKSLTDEQAIPVLMRRMDTIPVSMVLAQAAIESAWGQSRFAREANNLFGQWCFRPGCGIVPNSRPAGKTYEVKAFDSVDQGIAAYFQNINAFHRYSEIRDIREAARAAGKPLKGYDMVAGLQAYSTRGDEYIRELRAMIRGNKLE